VVWPGRPAHSARLAGPDLLIKPVGAVTFNSRAVFVTAISKRNQFSDRSALFSLHGKPLFFLSYKENGRRLAAAGTFQSVKQSNAMQVNETLTVCRCYQNIDGRMVGADSSTLVNAV